MIAVGPKLSGDAFYPQDLDLLMTLANQAGVAIKNAQLYAAVVVANEYIENIAATIESGVVAIDATGRVAHVQPRRRAVDRLGGREQPRAARRRASRPAWPSRCWPPSRDGQARTQPEVELLTAAEAEGPTAGPSSAPISPVRDPVGAVLGAVAVFSDLTPLKELEVERRRAEQLAYFQALASGIAHEIKNPLVAIKTFAQLLPRRRGDAQVPGRIRPDRRRARSAACSAWWIGCGRSRGRASGRGIRSTCGLPLGDALELVRPRLRGEEFGPDRPCSGRSPAWWSGNHRSWSSSSSTSC